MRFASVFLLCLVWPVAGGKPHDSPIRAGATSAKPHQYPWMARIDRVHAEHPSLRGHQCGGALIARPGMVDESDVVLTAAHCIVKAELEDETDLRTVRVTREYSDKTTMRIVAGAHLTKEVRPEYEERNVKHMEYYPDWLLPDPSDRHHDIALIQLDRPVSFSSSIKPIDLPQKGESPKKTDVCTVAGWGQIAGTITEPEYPDELMHLNVTVIPADECKDDLAYPALYKPEWMWCAQPKSGQAMTASCGGDSGGPLFCKRNGDWVAHGITSFGNGPCDAIAVGRVRHFMWPPPITFYAKIESHLDWIQETLSHWSQIGKEP